MCRLFSDETRCNDIAIYIYIYIKQGLFGMIGLYMPFGVYVLLSGTPKNFAIFSLNVHFTVCLAKNVVSGISMLLNVIALE